MFPVPSQGPLDPGSRISIAFGASLAVLGSLQASERRVCMPRHFTHSVRLGTGGQCTSLTGLASCFFLLAHPGNICLPSAQPAPP